MATCNVRGAFLLPELPKKTNNSLLKLTGQFADIMCGVNPEYDETVVLENGKRVLYLLVLQSI